MKKATFRLWGIARLPSQWHFCITFYEIRKKITYWFANLPCFELIYYDKMKTQFLNNEHSKPKMVCLRKTVKIFFKLKCLLSNVSRFNFVVFFAFKDTGKFQLLCEKKTKQPRRVSVRTCFSNACDVASLITSQLVPQTPASQIISGIVVCFSLIYCACSPIKLAWDSHSSQGANQMRKKWGRIGIGLRFGQTLPRVWFCSPWLSRSVQIAP
jgi:hypothetical protein